MVTSCFTFIISGLIAFSAQAEIFRVSKKINLKTHTPQILSITEELGTTGQSQILRKLPYYIVEGPGTDSHIVYQEELKTELSIQELSFLKTQKHFQNSQSDNVEIRDLVTDGPPQNRIHLTILGDGYTLNEKEKFFADAERITKSLFADETFTSYLGLFQVHAIFVPSRNSGIGDGAAKDTAFKLYRVPKGSKRAIYPGDEQALEKALRHIPRTDYPIVIANDDFYGGLGGRYAISTRSPQSGMIVLRHELGHNFGEVGEEYDGGSVYSGANSSSDSKATQWSQWRDDKKTYDAKFLSGNYLWQNLNNKPYRTSFKTAAGETLGLELSTVGWSSPNDVFVSINGKKLDLGESYHNDRNFYVLDNIQTQIGNNTLEIKENIKDGDNILATAFIYAYPPGFNFEKDVTAAFATYSDWGSKSYRPTHDSCLMRNMLLKKFCAVDQENMWHKFLARVSLIDSMSSDHEKVWIETPKISGLTVRWFNSQGTEYVGLRNQWVISKKQLDNERSVKAVVQLETTEVRKYDNKFVATKTLQL